MFGPKRPDHVEQAAKLGTNEKSGLARCALRRPRSATVVIRKLDGSVIDT
jgi:hypothetical protein